MYFHYHRLNRSFFFGEGNILCSSLREQFGTLVARTHFHLTGAIRSLPTCRGTGAQSINGAVMRLIDNLHSADIGRIADR